jgi:protein arginine kinase activator
MDKCPFTGLPCPYKKCIHVTEVTNLQATEAKDMCAACGLPYVAKEGGPAFDPKVNQVFQMINEVIKSAGLPEGKIILQPPVSTGCPTCGHTVEEIVITGKLGCGNCYDFYKKELMPLIEKCQSGATKHMGKSPQKNSVTLEQLENDLKAVIKIENYEKAAALRDEIKKLQSGK